MANQKKFIELTIIASTLFLLALNGFAQERRVKLRISNAGFTITALPLLAAKDWGLFSANGLDMEVILMQSSLVPAALTQGDIDFQAGVGPGIRQCHHDRFCDARHLVFFRPNFLLADGQTPVQNSREFEIEESCHHRLGRHGSRRFLLALEKLGVNPKDFVLVSIAGQQIQQLISLESGYVDAGAAVAAGDSRRAEKRLQQSLGRRRHGRHARRRPYRAG